MKYLVTIIWLILLFSTFTFINGYSQTITANTYTYSRSGFAPDLSGTTSQLLGSGIDNGASAVTNIGFTFWFAGTAYTQFSVNENGLMELGSTQISGNDVDISMASGTTLPKIAPYWGDFATGTNGYVVYKVTGTAPNRTLVVTWLVTIPKNTAGTANSTFQVQLSEATGVISFTYGTPAVPAGQFAIGIGVSTTDFASITPTSATAATCAYGAANKTNNISPGLYTRYYFTPDAALPTITYAALANTLLFDNRTLTATIGDAKTGVPTSGSFIPRIYYKKNYNGTFISSQGVLISGNSTSGSWSFSIDHSAVGGVIPRDSIYYFITAQDQASWKGIANIASTPAGVSALDVNTIVTPPAALAVYKILGAPISGVKTVGTSGADYTSLTKPGGIFEDINDGKLTGNLTINIITDLPGETGTKSLNAITSDAGGPYTITINPQGIRTVSGTGTIIKLNGANRVTIDGLNDGVNSLSVSSTSGAAIQFSSGASSDTVKRTTLTGAGTGVIMFYDVSGSIPGCSNNYINNCTINSGTAGIYFGSWATGPQGTNNVINNNIIRNFTQYGVHLDRGYLNFTISNNEIYQTAAGNYATGIYIFNPVGTTNIFNNKIHDMRSGTGLGVWTAGIYYRSGGATDVLNIYNNVIYLDAVTTNTASYQLYGVQLEGPGTSNVYYNSIYIGGTGVASGSSAGFYKTNGSANYLNNAVYNARSGGSGKHYGIYATGTFTSDYNDIFVNGSNGYFGHAGTSDLLTLNDWKSGAGKDLYSFSGDPGFTSTTNLAPDINSPNSYILNGNGTAITSINTDLNGNNRSTAINHGPTDIGAFEFNPSNTIVPNNALQVGNIAVGDSTKYYLGGKLLAAIKWVSGTALPTYVTLKYWSGETAPGLTGSNNGYGYWTISSDGTDFSYSISLNYNPASINTISSESAIILSKESAGIWSPILSSTVNTINKTVTLNGQNSFSNFILSDRSTTTYAVVNTKAFLQGPFKSGAMTTLLNSNHLIPLNSESVYPASIYGYTSKSVSSIPDTNVVDWILVELRTGLTANTKIASKAAFIKRDGSIVDLDGINSLAFPEVPSGSYYIVLRHRNHLPVMSSVPITLNINSSLYDFTTAQTQAYGSSPMAVLSGNVFGMIAGDGNDDGNIDYANDILIQWLPNFGFNGYYSADYDLNGSVEYSDIMLLWLMNFGLSGQLN